jgi:hypothetical protein
MSMRSVLSLEVRAAALNLPLRGFHREYTYNQYFLPPKRLGWYAVAQDGDTVFLGALLDDAFAELEHMNERRTRKAEA